MQHHDIEQVATLTLSIASASWVMTYIAVILIAHEFPFMQPHIGDARLLVPVASLAATISMARSPASAVGGVLTLGATSIVLGVLSPVT